jgi:glycosyltransferase involved in cell wall biosynthesis
MKRIRQKVFSVLFSLISPSYRKIKDSEIFDRDFYLKANPDVAAQYDDPLVHYLRGGWREGRLPCPGPLFDIGYYIDQNSQIEEGATEPLLHFITKGWRQGKKPNPYFDPLYYAQEQGDLELAGLNPLSHYIKKGWREGSHPRPYFDPLFYLRKYADVADSGLDPLSHYIRIGRKERRQPSLFFDVSWYIDRTPILQGVADDILFHYDDYGIREGKSPIPVFDPAYYIANYMVRADAGEDPLAHYIKTGERDGLRPCAWFDPVFYKQTYLEEGVSSALGHFLSEGVYRGVYPNGDVANLPEKPVLSLIVPVYNVTAHHLNNCIRSVLYQSYPHWQLCLADDCSTSPQVRPLLEEWAARDSRIRVSFLDENLGIAGATNAAAALATGEYIGFLDNDDELAAECLYRIVQTVCQTGADLLYTDEDLIGEDGRRFSVFHKPDYNPELLLCHNYVTHMVVTSRKLFEHVGELAADRAGAQDYDLFLKLAEQAGRIIHIPEVLYHWRASETSTSINHSQKEYADEAGRASVAAALARRGGEAEVLHTDLKFFYRTQRELYLLPLVSVVVYWDQSDRDPAAWLEHLIATTIYANYEVILLHEGGDVLDSLQRCLLASDQPIRPVEVAAGQGLAVLYNQALQHCDGDYVVFVGSDVAITDGAWLSALLEYCQTPDTGAVCGRLLSENSGLVELCPSPEIHRQSAWYYARYLQQASVLLNGLHCPQNIWSAAWECCVISKEALDRCGGFAASQFPDLFAIHDLSFQFLERGLQIYYTPYCQVEWRADARRFGQEKRLDLWAAEKLAFQEKWRQTLRKGDPFFNRGRLQDEQIPLEDFQDWFAGRDQRETVRIG